MTTGQRLFQQGVLFVSTFVTRCGGKGVGGARRGGLLQGIELGSQGSQLVALVGSPHSCFMAGQPCSCIIQLCLHTAAIPSDIMQSTEIGQGVRRCLTIAQSCCCLVQLCLHTAAWRVNASNRQGVGQSLHSCHMAGLNLLLLHQAVLRHTQLFHIHATCLLPRPAACTHSRQPDLLEELTLLES